MHDDWPSNHHMIYEEVILVSVILSSGNNQEVILSRFQFVILNDVTFLWQTLLDYLTHTLFYELIIS